MGNSIGQFGIISIDVGTIGFTLINTAIIVLAYYFLLHKKVVEIFKLRAEKISEDLDEAAESREAAKEYEIKCAELLRKGREEAHELVASAKVQAAREGEKLVGEAEKKAYGIRKHAEFEAKRSVEAAKNEVKSQIADLVIAAAAAVTASEVDRDKNEKIIDSFLAEI